LSGVILPPPLLNFDGKPRQFGKNRAFDVEKNSPRRDVKPRKRQIVLFVVTSQNAQNLSNKLK